MPSSKPILHGSSRLLRPYYKFHPRRAPAPSTQTKPILICKQYRGHKISGFTYIELDAARREIDRKWSKRLFDALDAAGRAAVLAEERALRI